MEVFFRLTSVRSRILVLRVEASEIPEAAVGVRILVFPLLHNLLVSLLNLLKSRFRLIFVGIINICIRMIFTA